MRPYLGKSLLRILAFSAALIILLQKNAIAAPIFTDGEEIGLLIVGTITHEDQIANVALIKETQSGHVRAVREGDIVLKSYKVMQVRKKFVIFYKEDQHYIVYQNRFAGEFTSLAKGEPQRMPESKYQEEGFERLNNNIVISDKYRDKLIEKGKENLSKNL